MKAAAEGALTGAQNLALTPALLRRFQVYCQDLHVLGAYDYLGCASGSGSLGQHFLNLYDMGGSHPPDAGGEEVVGVSDRCGKKCQQCLVSARHKTTSRLDIGVDCRL